MSLQANLHGAKTTPDDFLHGATGMACYEAMLKAANDKA